MDFNHPGLTPNLRLLYMSADDVENGAAVLFELGGAYAFDT
jgi:hypothetical protein